MNRIFVSVIVVFVVIAGLLIWQGSKSGTSRVYLPSELLAAGTEAHLQRIRVGGRVAALPIEYVVEPQIKLSFSVLDPGSDNLGALPVVYGSLKPDMFASGRDVIVDGEYRGGVLYASALLTQCPSKYEPPSPGSSNNQGSYPTDE